MDAYIKDLFKMVTQGKSPFHVVQEARRQLSEGGFELLPCTGRWELAPGGRYMVEHHGTTLFAFSIGAGYRAGEPFRIAAAHTDFPCLRIKPQPDVESGGCRQLNVEVYGGAILNTWLDRPLTIAGRVALKSDAVLHPRMQLFSSGEPLLTIPNLAIHMNRDVNKGVELNRQTDLLPIAAMAAGELPEPYFMSWLAKQLSVEAQDILDYELCVVNAEAPTVAGFSGEIVSSPRLDDLTSVQALVGGLVQAENKSGISMAALFDHEEIGSRTKQGAGSMLLRDVARKIMLSLQVPEDASGDSLYDSLLLSVDVAHAAHPNQMGKMDITNRPVLNGGICIKEACSQSYATDSEAIAILQQLCAHRDIPYQKFVNRSDIAGGGTLGSIASSLFPVRTVDIGVPVLAMHSARECMGTKDQGYLVRLMQAFFTL